MSFPRRFSISGLTALTDDFKKTGCYSIIKKDNGIACIGGKK